MIYWDKKNKQSEILVALDSNMQQAYKLKQEKYIELISSLQRMYHGYKYSWMLGGDPCKSGAEHTQTWNIKEKSWNSNTSHPESSTPGIYSN